VAYKIVGAVLFFFKKEPKTSALRGLNLLKRCIQIPPLLGHEPHIKENKFTKLKPRRANVFGSFFKKNNNTSRIKTLACRV
jgi:hypothetical protein